MSWKIRRDDERYYVDANTMPGAQKALHLAAAAPELLEALELVVSFIDAGQGTWTIEDQNKARAAIAKAKGEEQ